MQVIGTLKAAFVQGRRPEDEYDARVAKASASQTHADLAVLIDDIPAGSVTARPPTARHAGLGVCVIMAAAAVLGLLLWWPKRRSPTSTPASTSCGRSRKRRFAVAGRRDRPASARAEKALADLYATLTPWQKTMVARAQGRPRFGDYVKALIGEFTPLAGDRYFGEDEAIVGGLGRFEGESVCILGQEKGDDTAGRVRHNFGMARPEGYRKAVRLMELADRFDLPVISLVDTAGAFPGVEAEERGQAEAIARSTDACLSLGVPNVAVIIGEGGLGRRSRHRHLQQGADARTCNLHRRLARGVGLDPVARIPRARRTRRPA